jgi:hypothetical protein
MTHGAHAVWYTAPRAWPEFGPFNGSTRLLEVLDLLVPRPWLTGRVTRCCPLSQGSRDSSDADGRRVGRGLQTVPSGLRVPYKLSRTACAISLSARYPRSAQRAARECSAVGATFERSSRRALSNSAFEATVR